MLLTKYVVCDSKNSKYIKQEASGLLSSLGIKMSLSKIRSSFVLTVLSKLIQGIKWII